MPSVHEQLSGQFYRWESRGRGWQVFGEPVWPEPAFQPFAGYHLPPAADVDDGRVPSFLGSLFRKKSSQPSPVIAEIEAEPEPTPLTRESLVEFQALLPADLDVARETFDPFFRNLSLCREPMTFELLGIHKQVFAQFAASAADAAPMRRQLAAHFPDVQFRQLEGALEKAWEDSEGDQAFVVEFGLEREFMFQLATGKLDPFIGIIGALAELQPGEMALFQVIWQPVQNPWAESIVHSLTLPDGKPMFVNAPELASAAENKASQPLFAAVVRIMGRAATTDRLHEIARELAASLRVFADSQGNALIPLHNEDYPFVEHIEDALRRQSRRSGMLLNRDELIGFVHLPSSAVRSPTLQRDAGRTKATPDIVRKSSGVLIGDNEHNGDTVQVYLAAEQRVRHTHIIGSNGTGKSSLLLNMIRQDIENHDGVAVLDPHGDLIDQILGCIPADRINDVVLVDLSDEDFPIGFNLLHAHSEIEKRLLASDLVGVFRRLSTTWGDQMDTVLQNAILAFLKSSQGGTLADLRRFLRDQKFRSEFLHTVQDVEVLTFWQEIFPTLGATKSVNSLLARLQEFFSQEPLRNMVSQRVNKLDFADIMDRGKIFLAKLSTGLGGEENSYLLGTLLVSKFQQLAMARQAQKQEARRDFWLYIDEFQNFISPSMEKILTGARKYRLGFTLAHQNLHQLQDNDKVASAVMTQPCTRIVLQVGDDDAKKLGECFDSFDAKSLTRLEKYHAIIRVERNDFDFNLALRKPELPDDGEARRAAVIAASRAQYAVPRAEVEAALLAEMRSESGKPKPPPPPPDTGAPPDVGSKPPPKPVSPSSTPTATLAPETTEVVKPTLPPPVVSEPVVPPAQIMALINLPESKSTTISEKKTPSITDDLGKGGEQHKAMQKRIKEAAEALGFRSVIEQQIAGGQESVDLLLERGDQKIACEISVTTTIDHEIGNIRKCIKAGLLPIAIICVSEHRLQKIATAVSGSLGKEASTQVVFFQPDQFISYLKSLPLPAPKEETVIRRGYKVKHTRKELTESERQEREALLHKIMAEAIQLRK